MPFWVRGDQKYQKSATQADADAFEDLFARYVQDIEQHGQTCESPEEVPDVLEGPDALVSALANLGDNELLKVLALTFHEGQKKKFQCFYCKGTGHMWTKCRKLWDVLKQNRFSARPRQALNQGKPTTDLPKDFKKGQGDAGTSRNKTSFPN